MQRRFTIVWTLLVVPLSLVMGADTPPPATSSARAESPGDRLLADYFRAQTAALSARSLAEVKTLEDWNARKGLYRRQLAEMLGLDPMPPRTPLQPVITGKIDAAEFTVENLQFQSSPGLYVTGNLYLPRGAAGPAPAILYVCGHSKVKKDGVNYGAKTAYQHHGEWFARNGYVCLIIDTLEAGEIEGQHHGTYSQGMWWWHSRGYTPAGVEAWNGIRALDYLCSRPEVDARRIGMTGRSGGGAYTWWVAALDDRIQAACPVAGITDLQNHVVDGTIEGHCDCMFMVNTYRWDFAQVAALMAPRPLLIGNSDKDAIFPLDGVYRLHEQVRRIYRLHGADKNLGLLITEGPHKDTQDLQVPVFRWFNRFLKNDEGTVDKVATTFFQPPALKVFKALPPDQANTTIHESFVPPAPVPKVPASAAEWAAQRDAWHAALAEKTFGGWPASPPALDVKQAFSARQRGVAFRAFDFISQEHVPLRLFVAQGAGEPSRTVLTVLDEESWPRWLVGARAGFGEALKDMEGPPGDRAAFEAMAAALASGGQTQMWVAPRGVGPSAWNADPKKQTQIKRRFALLGQTLDGMRVWDIRRAIQAARAIEAGSQPPLWLAGERRAAGLVLYASIFEPGIAGIDLRDPPRTHREGPDLLNVLKTLDMPAAAAMAAERGTVRIAQRNADAWKFPAAVAAKLAWGADRVQVVQPATDAPVR